MAHRLRVVVDAIRYLVAVHEVAGEAWLTNKLFRFGASTVLWPEKPDPEKILQVIDKYKPTFFFSVPTLFARLLRGRDVGPSQDTNWDEQLRRLQHSASLAPMPITSRAWSVCAEEHDQTRVVRIGASWKRTSVDVSVRESTRCRQ